jgi:hypothetical protein
LASIQETLNSIVPTHILVGGNYLLAQQGGANGYSHHPARGSRDDDDIANYHVPTQDTSSSTANGLVQGGNFVPTFPEHPSPAQWIRGSDDFVLDISRNESHYLQPPSGGGQYQGLAGQFPSGSSFGLAENYGSSTSFNISGAFDAVFPQPIKCFTNNDGYGPLDTSVGFNASSIDWNSGLPEATPGSATDTADFRGTDYFPPFDMGFYNQFNAAEFQANPGLLSTSAPIPRVQSTGPAIQPPPGAAPDAVLNQTRVPCSILGCPVAFNRDSDRIRHEAAVHGFNQALQLHLCPILNCPKSQGAGYTRKDKLTEHMWKKHGDLGYVKRVL